MAATPIVKVIYGKPMLPDLARVLACLYEKKIMFELEDMNKGVRMPQDILNLQISSHGHTPVLIDGLDELFGSRKICRHVVEKYGVYGCQYLLGKDPLARVSVEQWIQSEEHSYDPPSSALVFYLAFKIEADVEKKSKSEKKMEKVLNLYEQRLGESEFLAGNYFTLADLYHLPNTYYLESSAEYGYLFKDRKNVSRWWKNISGRDSWKKVVKKFEEEDLQFNALVSNSKTEQSSSSSPRNNGIRSGPIAGSETGSKNKGAKADIRENKEDMDASDNKKEPTLGKKKIGGEVVHSKIEGEKEETPSPSDKVPGASKPVIKYKKETSKSDDDDKSVTGDNDKSGRTDEIKEQNVNKPATEVKKEEPKPADKDKSISGITAERKEADANKPVTEGKKEEPKPADKDKSISGITAESKEADANKPATEGEKEEAKPADKDKSISGITAERKEGDANKPATEGKKEESKPADKDKSISGITAERKEGDANKQATEGKKEEPKPADKDKSISGITAERKEGDANKQATEGKKEEPKPADKDKSISGITAERKEADANKPATEGEKNATMPDGKSKSLSAEEEKSRKTDEIKERDANKPDITSERKESDANKKGGEGVEVPPKPDGKDKDQLGQATRNKIDEDEGHEANELDTEGKKDGLKSDDKYTDSSRKEREGDVKKENDSAPIDGEDKTLPTDNKKL